MKTESHVLLGRRVEIALRLVSARMGAVMTQTKAAEALGMHRPSLSEIEAGRRSVRAEALRGFAELYGVSIGWLAGEGPRKRRNVRDRMQLRRIGQWLEGELRRSEIMIRNRRRSR